MLFMNSPQANSQLPTTKIMRIVTRTRQTVVLVMAMVTYVTVLLLSHAMFPVTAFVIYYFLFVSMQYGTTSVVDIYFSLFAMFTDFYDVPYHSI